MAAINRFYYPTKYKSRDQVIALGIKCVFISHQKRDSAEAKKIAEYLENSDIDIYFDEYDKDLRIHHENNNPKEVTKAICNGINNSSHMLVLVSPNSLTSSWVPFEIGFGYDRTELTVLCLKGIPKGKLPEYIRSATIIRDIYDFNNFIERLSGIPKQQLIENRKIMDYHDYRNPVYDIMDNLISDIY
jgi:hypothetical protein